MRVARPTAAGSAALAALLVLTGCTSNPFSRQVTLGDNGSLYGKAEIAYNVDPARLNLPLAASRIEARQVAYEHVTSGPGTTNNTARLTLKYPHPEGRAGVAQARLEIAATGPSAVKPVDNSTWGRVKSTTAKVTFYDRFFGDQKSGTVVQETWEADLPKQRLDAIIAELNRSGFFADGQSSSDGTQLTAQLDKKKANKSWQQVPALDAVMYEIREQGRLVAYTRAGGSLGPVTPHSTPPGVASYGSFAGTSTATPSAGGAGSGTGPAGTTHPWQNQTATTYAATAPVNTASAAAAYPATTYAATPHPSTPYPSTPYPNTGNYVDPAASAVGYWAAGANGAPAATPPSVPYGYSNAPAAHTASAPTSGGPY